MINLQQMVQQLVKEAQVKHAKEENCNLPMIKKDMKKDKEKEVKKDEIKKVAETLRYVLDNWSQLLPSSPIKEAEEKFKKSVAPRGHFPFKRDDMAHTKDDPAKTHDKIVNGKEQKTTKNEKVGKGDHQATLQNTKSAQRVIGKLAEEQFKTMDSTQPTGGQAHSGYGNENRHYIESNQAAVDYTKRDVKRDYIKDQVGKLFSHVDPEKDTVIRQNFTRGVNTSKLAGLETLKKMKNMVDKEEKDEAVEEKIMPGIHKKVEKEEKKESATAKMASILNDPNHPKRELIIELMKKAALGVTPGDASSMETSPSAMPAAPPQMGAPGAQKPPGCTCMQGMDGQPLCSICNIQKILQQAQQGQQGQPQVGGQSPEGGIQ